MQERSFALAAAFCLLMAGCGKGSGSDGPPSIAGDCRIVAAEPISRSSAPLGFSAEQVLAHASAREDLLLLYGADPSRDPATGLQVWVESWDASRIFVVHQGVELLGDVEVPCPPAITFPATIRFRTADGAFDESFETDLLATRASEYQWYAQLSLGALRGDFDVAGDRNSQWVGFAGRAFQGRLSGGVSLSSRTRQGAVASTVGFWGESPPYH